MDNWGGMTPRNTVVKKYINLKMYYLDNLKAIYLINFLLNLIIQYGFTTNLFFFMSLSKEQRLKDYYTFMNLNLKLSFHQFYF